MKEYKDGGHGEANALDLLQRVIDSEQMLRSIFDNAIVPIIVMEPSGRITQANPAFLDLLGYEPEDLPNLDIRNLSSPEDPAMFDQVVVGKIDSYVVEKHYRRKDGRKVDVIVSASGLRDKDGNLRCVVAVIQDMSICKALERNLIEEKLMFESLLHYLPVGVNYVRQGRIEYANPAFCRIFGYSEAEVLGTPFNDFMPACLTAIRRNIGRLYSRDISVLRCEEEARNKNGQQIFIEAMATVGHIDGEDCLIIILNDVTLRKQLEARYSLLFESANDIVLVLEPDSLRIVDANRKATEVYGYTREELLQMTVKDLTLPQTKKKEGGKTASTEEIEWPIGNYPRVQVKKNGEKVPVDVNSFEVEWQGQKAIVSIVRDVTEHRRLQQQLMQADKLASLGSLVAGIAHEINNPNNFISFNIPILEEYWKEILPVLDLYARQHPDWTILGMTYEEFRVDVLKLLNNMQHGSERINAIVSELRDFARIQRDEYRASVDVERLVNRVVTLTGKQVAKLVSSFEIDVEKNLPEIVVNPARIEQVLINLVLNAAQAADKEKSFVRLAARLNPANPEEIIFEVIDNGCGMDEYIKSRVFDPFFTTKEGPEGTGLGLSISYAIVQDHNGSITIESTPGEGTIVRVVLPVKGQVNGD